MLVEHERGALAERQGGDVVAQLAQGLPRLDALVQRAGHGVGAVGQLLDRAGRARSRSTHSLCAIRNSHGRSAPRGRRPADSAR